ncbi:RHS repeat-associated protein [Microbacterium testaceum]|uniref:RHS repeat-associated core domain-containing protein n=1 Tax=Microbacterium TaxID=33882 RepID=UPI001AEB1D2F|nr:MULTISPECIES: RHS repeat-associated core domain-containing protein [Microbacterium]MDQ1111250.1 RHS repeat-associated protein [Microbacterium testaceum]MDR6098212.1 RHS repeat-associated protein [Microbacterium sp. SORGH_AS_0454]
MTSRPGQTVTFNEFGKVSTVTVAASSVTQSNVYDASGNLLLRNSSAEGVALFLGDTVLTQAPNGGAIRGVRTYAAANGIPVAERSATAGVAGTVVTWLFADINGTVDTQTVAKTGVTTKQYRDPFGMPTGGTSGVWADGNGYLNKPLTASTGLTSIGARNYDPRLGKFISVDPVVNPKKPQQNSGYAYSGGNPVTWSDPSGLAFDDCSVVRGCLGAPRSRPALKSTVTSPSSAGTAGGYQSRAWDNLSNSRRGPGISFPAPGSKPSPLNSLGYPQGGRPAAAAGATGPNETGRMFNWTDSLSKLANKWGVPLKDVKDAVHGVKNDGMLGGRRSNPDVEVDTETGDVRIKGGDGDVIGNVGEYLNPSMSAPPRVVQIDWGTTIGAVIIGTVVVVGGIVSSPAQAALG